MADSIDDDTTGADNLKDVLLAVLPSTPDCLGAAAGLGIRLIHLPRPPRSSQDDGIGDSPRKKALRDRLEQGGWLKVKPSGMLELDNVPTRWDIPVRDIIELMTMESADNAMRLAHHFLAGFVGPVKRSLHADWTTPHAIQALCKLQSHVRDLNETGNPTAELAKEFSDKFQMRLVTAWERLSPAARAESVSTLIPVLDDRELADFKALQPAPNMWIADDMLHSMYSKDRHPETSRGMSEQPTSINHEDMVPPTILPSPPEQGSWKEQLEGGLQGLKNATEKKLEATSHVQQIASALASAPSDYFPREATLVMYQYFSALVEAKDWAALGACCSAFAPAKEGHAVGQALLATALGGLATDTWFSGRTAEPAATMLASFLRTTPISPEAMKQFAYASQRVFGTLTCMVLLTQCKRLLAAGNGDAELTRWVDAIAALVKASPEATESLSRHQSRWEKFGSKNTPLPQ